ncbi:6-bladed beta-propeller [Balneola sp. MJW-20]|uniref:6-bladed beta-propeller n=1 Tax=Gracilimonas aurantiaca TaxID=3234185 RepID=UPI00390B4990
MKNFVTLFVLCALPMAMFSQTPSIDYRKVFIPQDTLHFKSDELSGAMEFASSGSGGLFVLDHLRNQVYKFDEQLNLLNSFGRNGKGPGEFTKASDIYYDNNRVYILDSRQLRVSIFQENGDFLKSFLVDERATDMIVFDGQVCIHPGGIIPPKGKQINCYSEESGEKIRSFSTPSDEISGKFLTISNLTFNTIQKTDNHIISLSHPIDAKIYVWDLEGKLINQFMVDNEIFFQPSFPKNYSPAAGPLNEYTTATISSVFADENEIRVIYIENGTGVKFCYLYDYEGNQINEKPIDFEKRYITYQTSDGNLISVSYTEDKSGLVLNTFKKAN